MKRLFTATALILFSGLTSAPAAPSGSWQESLARMPLAGEVTELNRSNCVPAMLRSFQPDETVKALCFLPGATDEFYFFRRAHARLTNAAPSLLDAVIALTNQTFIRATFRPPLLLIHTAEDPPAPMIRVEDAPTAERLRKKRFLKQFVWNDRDWFFVHPLLSFELDIHIIPGPKTRESNHFFRHSIAAYNLNAWEALEAISLVNKTQIVVQKKKLIFDLDDRDFGKAVVPDNWIPEGLKR